MHFFKEKRPTRKMLSMRGIAYDKLLDSLREELAKTNTKVILCLDEIDQLEETELLYNILRTRISGGNCTDFTLSVGGMEIDSMETISVQNQCGRYLLVKWEFSKKIEQTYLATIQFSGATKILLT